MNTLYQIEEMQYDLLTYGGSDTSQHEESWLNTVMLLNGPGSAYPLGKTLGQRDRIREQVEGKPSPMMPQKRTGLITSTGHVSSSFGVGIGAIIRPCKSSLYLATKL